MGFQGITLIFCLLMLASTPAFSQSPFDDKEFTDFTCYDVWDLRNGMDANAPLLGYTDYNDEELNEWFYHSGAENLEPPKAVAIVAHGLNNWPSTTNDITRSLNENGVDVYRMALTGHRGSTGEMQNLSRGFWLLDALQAYCWARLHASINVVPLYFVGFSNGALVMQDFMSLKMKNMTVNIDSQVLLAPAIALNKWPRRGAKILTYFDFKNLIPSFAALTHHSANEGTSVAAYHALLYSMEQTQKNGLVDIPTLVLMDPKDELIDEMQISDLIFDLNLENWSMEFVYKDNYRDSKFNHHYIYNAEAAGPTLWQNIENRLLEFLIH